METLTKEINKTALLATNKATGEQDLYSSYKNFLMHNKQYKLYQLVDTIGRKKIPYEDTYIKVEKLRFKK